MSIETWAASEFTRLGYQNPKEIVAYLLKIEEESCMEEYFGAVLDISDSEHKQFMKEFLQKYSEEKSSLGPGFYRKPDIGDDTNDALKSKSKEKGKTTPFQTDQLANSQPPVAPKKKSKFVSLYSEEGQNRDVILIPGRNKCNCQASKHKLINNCLKCGRIVCEQEGSGPCAFCQSLVISKEEKEIINRGTKKSEALHNKLIHSKKVIDAEEEVAGAAKALPKGLQRAIDHKNKLLEFDRTSEKRTKVYDDECDYFQSNSKWINPADKEKLQQLENEIRSKKYDRNRQKFTIDLLGRKVVNEREDLEYNPDNPMLKEILEGGKPDIYSYGENEGLLQELNFSRPLYVESGDVNTEKSVSNELFSTSLHRLQDRELQEMRDEGMCLSMHQPWASLLIARIKRHEGRSWYHSHRGRLWIASAAKVPAQSDISHTEQMYSQRFKEPLHFPAHYPTGCLLGCVDVVDILPQEEYRRQFPDGESESPYVFVCDHPQEMIVKFPIKGEHKIFKLDPKIHQAALKTLGVN